MEETVVPGRDNRPWTGDHCLATCRYKESNPDLTGSAALAGANGRVTRTGWPIGQAGPISCVQGATCRYKESNQDLTGSAALAGANGRVTRTGWPIGQSGPISCVQRVATGTFTDVRTCEVSSFRLDGHKSSKTIFRVRLKSAT